MRIGRIALDLLARRAGVDRHDRHFLCLRVGFEDAEIGDEFRWPLCLYAKPLTFVTATTVTKRRDEIELVDEAPFALRHDDGNLTAGRRDLLRAAAAG